MAGTTRSLLMGRLLVSARSMTATNIIGNKDKTLLTNIPSPLYGGGTGGLLRKAQLEEYYVVFWISSSENLFEMPTGGVALMRRGSNLVKLARKEQCLSLTTQLRSKFNTDSSFYRVFPNGELQLLHPSDGVYPEKVNSQRTGSNQNMWRIGKY